MYVIFGRKSRFFRIFCSISLKITTISTTFVIPRLEKPATLLGHRFAMLKPDGQKIRHIKASTSQSDVPTMWVERE